MKLLLVLGCLLVGLIVMVFLAERFGKSQSPDAMRSMGRWVLPLIALLLLLQIVQHYWGG